MGKRIDGWEGRGGEGGDGLHTSIRSYVQNCHVRLIAY